MVCLIATGNGKSYQTSRANILHHDGYEHVGISRQTQGSYSAVFIHANCRGYESPFFYKGIQLYSAKSVFSARQCTRRRRINAIILLACPRHGNPVAIRRETTFSCTPKDFYQVHTRTDPQDQTERLGQSGRSMAARVVVCCCHVAITFTTIMHNAPLDGFCINFAPRGPVKLT